MSRSLSSAAAAALHAQETSEAFIKLVEISGGGLSVPIRAASSRTDVVSNGATYTAYPFEISLPQEDENRPPEVELVIDNIDRTIVDAVRSLSSPPTVTLSIVLESSPDTVEAGPFNFTMKSASWNKLTVSGRLSYEAILDEPYPAGTFNPVEFPGLYK